MAYLKEETMKNWIVGDDSVLLENNLGGCNVGDQAQASKQRLCPKVVERLSCSVCRSLDRLYVKMLTKSILVLIKLKIN